MTDQTEPTDVAHQGNRVAVRNYLDADLDGRWRYAQSLAQAGNLLPDAMRDSKSPEYSPGRIYLITETGAMLGLHPVAALSSINVIEGKPAISAAGMAGVIRAAGHKLRVAETGTVEGGDYAVTTTLIRSDDPDAPFTSTWTPHRAARAGLCSYTRDNDGVWRVVSQSQRGNPLPWQLYTESLCKARSMSEVGRDGGQDVLLGVRYTPEELGAVVNETGDVIAASYEPAEPEPEQPKRRASRAKTGTQGTRRKAADDPADAAEATPEPEAAPVAEPEPEPESKPAPEDGDGPSAAERIATVEHADLPEPAAPQAEPEPEPLEPEYDVAPNGEVIYREADAWDQPAVDPGVPEYDASWPFGERAKWLDEFGTDSEMGRQLWLDWQNAPGVDFTQADKAQLLAAKAKMEQRVADQRPAALA